MDDEGGEEVEGFLTLRRRTSSIRRRCRVIHKGRKLVQVGKEMYTTTPRPALTLQRGSSRRGLCQSSRDAPQVGFEARGCNRLLQRCKLLQEGERTRCTLHTLELIDTEAINCLRLAVDLYTDEGRFSMAAKYQKEIGELYEAEMDFEHAIEAYQKAADFFEGENSVR